MFNVNEYVVYKNDVCLIKEIKEKHIGGKDYYVLSPLKDSTLTMYVPVEKGNLYLRNIVSKEEAELIIKKMKDIPIIEEDDKQIERVYHELLLSGKHEDLVRIIKTTYLKNEKRKEMGKKIADKDSNYFKKAEDYLYTELSLALNMSYEECRLYIIEKVSKNDG